MIARLLLEGSLPVDTSGRHLTVISICFLDFLFVLSRDLSLWVVSKKSSHLGFCVRLSWMATIGFVMQIRHGPYRSSGLVASGMRGGKDVTQSKPLPLALQGRTL